MTKQEFKEAFDKRFWEIGCRFFEEVADYSELAWEIIGDELEAKEVKIFQLEQKIQQLEQEINLHYREDNCLP